MRKISFILCLIPSIALADDKAFDQWLVDEALGRHESHQFAPPPVAGYPVQPVLPVPQDKGPWGTGYSIVTTTRPTRNLWDQDRTGAETVQRVVPNNAIGQPMKGLDLNNW